MSNRRSPITDENSDGSPPSSDDPKDKFLWEVHRYTNEYIRFADTKAAFIAAAATGLIGTLVASSTFDSCFHRGVSQWSKLQWCGMVGLFCLLIALISSVLVIRPRLWNKTHKGFIFWESIVGHRSAHAFSRAFLSLKSHELAPAISDHLFVLASVAKRKYEFVKLAVYSGAVGGLLTGLVLFLQHTLR